MSIDVISKIQALAESGLKTPAAADQALTEIYALCAITLIDELTRQGLEGQPGKGLVLLDHHPDPLPQGTAQ